MKISKLKQVDFEKGLCDSSRATADMAVESVCEDTSLLRELIDFSFIKAYPLNMRSARVVQLFCAKHPEMIMPYLDEVISKMAHSKTDGVKRSYLKVINDELGPEKVEDPGLLVQLCFDWLVSNAETVSVRYHCLGILDKISKHIPDLRPEFLEVLRMLAYETTGSRGLDKLIRESINQ